jgi:integrase
MPHFPKPFFRASRGLWYLQVGGKQINLGCDREAAFRQYHEIMGQPRPVAVAANAVVVILDLFLEWTRKNRSSGSYGWYLEHLTPFARSLPDGLTVDAIRPFHVQEYLDSKTTWSNTTKRGAVIAIKRSFNWAEKIGHTDRNPLRHVEKPEAGRREQVVSLLGHQRILAMVQDQEFTDLLTAAWETGARPQELFRVEARHVDLKNGRWVFPKNESKGKRHSRTIYLNDRMIEMTRCLMLKRPEGPLFRNADGRPWTAFAVNCRFVRIRGMMGRLVMRERKVKLDEEAVIEFAKTIRSERRTAGRMVPKPAAEIMWEARGKMRRRYANQYAPKYCLYTWRHSFATRLLEAGVDAMIVATLLGHVDTTMLGKVYSHVAQNPAFLREVIQKAAG